MNRHSRTTRIYHRTATDRLTKVTECQLNCKLQKTPALTMSPSVELNEEYKSDCPLYSDDSTDVAKRFQYNFLRCAVVVGRNDAKACTMSTRSTALRFVYCLSPGILDFQV